MTRQIKIFKVIYPWSTDEFKKAWIDWRTYKKEAYNFHYKSQLSEQKALNYLQKLSDNNEGNALEIIDYTISRQWEGFFKPKSYKNATGNQVPERHIGAANALSQLKKLKGTD